MSINSLKKGSVPFNFKVAGAVMSDDDDEAKDKAAESDHVALDDQPEPEPGSGTETVQ